MRYSKEQQLQALEMLKAIKNKTMEQTPTPYAIVTSVARSGMSRTIRYYLIDDNKELHNITYPMAVLLYEPYYDNKGLKVTGAGMDMVFNTLYRLNHRMIDFNKELNEDQKHTARVNRGGYDYFISTNYRSL